MDFSYFNTDGKKIKLNISVGQNWDSLNIKNNQLNSIFNKIDDGDRNVSQEEMTLLETLFNKADRLLDNEAIKANERMKQERTDFIFSVSDEEYQKYSKEEWLNMLQEKFPIKKGEILLPTAGNKILENEELDEIIKQIDEGKISLPERKNKVNNAYAYGYIEIQYSRDDYKTMRKNREEFFKNKIEMLKRELERKYPKNEYKIEITPYHNGYSYEVIAFDKNKKSLGQINTTIRSDGIELEIKDHLDTEITDTEGADYSNIHQTADWGEFTIIDKNGKKHTLRFMLEECSGKDALDCRRVQKKVMEFLANLPTEKINELIEKDVKEIRCYSQYEDSLVEKEEYLKNKDEDGNVIIIQEAVIFDGHKYDDASATIISPSFAIPKREYAKEHSIEKEGYKFNISDTSDNTAILKGETADGNSFEIDIWGEELDTFHQWQVPKLKNILSQLPASVLDDFQNEITEVNIISHGPANGQYSPGSTSIMYKADSSLTPVLSFVHEIGHAIDDQSGTMFSKTPEFSEKFSRFKTIVCKLGINSLNHALAMPEEFFASAYAHLQMNSSDKYEKMADHIAEIEDFISKFENSDDPEKIECKELFQSLLNDVNNRVEEVRTQPKSVRANTEIRDLIRKECKDLLKEAEQYNPYYYLSEPSIELEMIRILSSDDNNYNSEVSYYEKASRDELDENDVLYGMLNEEMRTHISKMVEHLKALRAKIKNN